MLIHADLDAELNALLAAPGWYVGFSGGIDSTVLLHVLHAWRAEHPAAPPLHAIHVNHGLQPAAPVWQHHCEAVCESLALPITSCSVEVSITRSAEAAARDARYGIFEAQLPPGGIMFLGHHLDDQVETILLRLMRGAGVEGMAGIPRRRRLGEGTLVRPLLDVARSDIERYAALHGLAWVDDPSNDNTAMDRNFLRAQLLPLLASRWPGYRQTIGRTGQHMAAAAAVMADALGAPATVYSALGDAGLPLDQLLEGLEDTAAARLRVWLRATGHQAPDSARLAEFLRQLRVAAIDAGPRLECGHYSLQRYREAVYLVPKWEAPSPTATVFLAPGARVVVPGAGAVSLQPASENGLSLAPGERFTLRWRRGGERCRLPGRAGSHRLKTLWQEWRVPPWWRDRVPLLYVDEELLAIGDIARCASTRWQPRAHTGEQLWTFRWERHAVLD